MSTTNDEQGKKILHEIIPTGPITKDHARGVKVDERGNIDQGVVVRSVEQPKREPVLSDVDLAEMFGAVAISSDGVKTLLGDDNYWHQAKSVRDRYENEITEGRLMVVKECRMTYSGCINEPGQSHPVYHHEGCPDDSGSEVLEARVGDDVHTSRANFCPGCGAKIVKA